MKPERDEFYVGYLPKGPPGVARRARLGVLAAFLVGATVAATLAVGQAPFDPGTFEFGDVREFHGIVVEHPYPLLVVEDEAGGFRSHLLVDFGKHGAASVAGMDGRFVRLRGQRIYNAARRMIEIERGSVQPADRAVPAGLADWRAMPEQPLGDLTFRGEVVDAKCHLGVMKPGRQKPHKACAILCIKGGIPPVLRVENAAGALTYLLLVSPEGQPVNGGVLPYVAEPVEVRGRVVRRGDQLVLFADPATYRRL